MDFRDFVTLPQIRRTATVFRQWDSLLRRTVLYWFQNQKIHAKECGS